MRSWNAFVLAVTLLTLPEGAHGLSFFAQLFNSCFDGPSCGLFGFSVVKHSSSGTGDCTEYCVFFSSPDLECGGCPSNIANEETTTPGFDIYYDLVGVPASDTSIFVDARTRWQSVILSDLNDIASGGLDTASLCSFPSSIDDLYICAQYSSIDGAGKVLGQAGPTYIRTSNALTITGEMEFDSPDIANLRSKGTLSGVILHEIGHIIGIGTLWSEKGVVGAGSSCPYLGPKATAAFRNISGCNVAAPTETDGSPGTACGHWDEDCMDSELMTGYVRNATVLPLSRVTVGSLEDLGYTVDYSQADPFTKSNLNPNCQCRRRSQEVVQFSLHSSAPRRRQLSDEGYQTAWDYGINVLTERAQKFQLTASMQDENDAPEIQYVGHKLLSVLFEEDGEIYGVMVTNP